VASTVYVPLIARGCSGGQERAFSRKFLFL